MVIVADGIGNWGRRCTAGAAAAVLLAAGASASASAASPGQDGDAAPRAGGGAPLPAVWSGDPDPASAAYAPGVPPSVAAALAPTDPAGGERAAAMEEASLSMAVSDDRDTIAAGEEVVYTLTLRNEGEEEKEAVLSQRVSAEARFVDVGADGMATGGVATWRVVVGPGERIERTARVRLGEPGERLWRVATTACAQTEAGRPPVACASDTNRVDTAARAGASAVSAPQRVLTVTSILTGVLIVLATGAAVFVLWFRRPASRRRTLRREDAE
ncbi:hypothetical protein FZ103_07275 [Streptomonospora sp. PA3]|uniref:hypothetical protein n=1 Tax=Streptomonospora sp. PA3 TaxID=2607326 RepID=UPI0012DF4AD8|nr:hypothetical protein [Streptomonospora sp. PA3]MUL40989.1 hypothetical protein [Streptomonospora sp. PA3]